MTSFGMPGQTFSLFCLWPDFGVCQGWGGETCAHPLQNKGFVLGSAGMNPTPLKRTIS